MKRSCTWLAALLTVAMFGTATALAQPASSAIDVGTDGNAAKYVPLVLAGDTQEEVEILRRLLDKGFAAVYGCPQQLMIFANSGGMAGASMAAAGMGGGGSAMGSGMGPLNILTSGQDARPAADLQGVYLKDYGVVYTVTLPPPPNQMSAGPTAGAVTRTPLSPWERTRKELRGEKIEEDGKPVNGAGLSDVILKVLADNGKHLTRLAEGERITVVVTFRDAAANGIYHPELPPGHPALPGMAPGGGSTGGGPQGMLPAFGSFASSDGRGIEAAGAGSSQIGGSFTASALAAGGSSPGEAPEDFAAWLTDVRNAVRLGDLHLKRGKIQDAITAYKEGLARLEKELISRRNAPGTAPGGVGADAGDVPVLLMEVEVCNKMAQVYLQTGDSASGRAMIQRASKLAKQAETLTGAAAEANPRPSTPALPCKLIITASKKLLDEVGSGKTSFEAFRKIATVEYVKPPAADKK